MGTFFEFASNITTMLYLVFLLLKDDWFENLSTIHLPSEKIQIAKATSKGVLDSNYFNNHLWNHLSVSLQMKSNFFREQYPLYYCVKFRNFNNFLVRKFCGKAQFRIVSETVPFSKISTPGNYVKLRHFTQCTLYSVFSLLFLMFFHLCKSVKL